MWPSSKTRLKSALAWYSMKDSYDRKSVSEFSTYIKLFGRPSGTSYAHARYQIPISTQENSALRWKSLKSQRKFVDFVRHLCKRDQTLREDNLDHSDAENGLKKNLDGEISNERQMNVYGMKCGTSRIHVVEMSLPTPPSMISSIVSYWCQGPKNSKGIIVTENAATLIWMLEHTTHVLIITENDMNNWTREDCCNKASTDLVMFNKFLCDKTEESDAFVKFLVYKRMRLAIEELKILSDELTEGGEFEPFASYDLLRDRKGRWVFEDEEDFIYVSDCHMSPFVRNVADMIEQWENRLKARPDSNPNIIVDIIQEVNKPEKKMIFGLDENKNPVLIHSDKDINKMRGSSGEVIDEEKSRKGYSEVVFPTVEC